MNIDAMHTAMSPLERDSNFVSFIAARDVFGEGKLPPYKHEQQQQTDNTEFNRKRPLEAVLRRRFDF